MALGLIAGSTAAGQWRTYMQWRNSVEFGQTDAQFGRDISFFAFDLPFYKFVLGFAFAVQEFVLQHEWFDFLKPESGSFVEPPILYGIVAATVRGVPDCHGQVGICLSIRVCMSIVSVSL